MYIELSTHYVQVSYRAKKSAAVVASRFKKFPD